ncbi:YceI family protein [Iodidimonas sp. SYSU 1G8]|uniref:YceI family protein n=1 Tax=Iodidimonas sp. SYSU 1G8 TaxID=3133967 RepID=UPI0031FEC094
MKRMLFAACAAVALIGSPALATAAQDNGTAASTAPVPGGAYTLDKAHASLTFSVNHLGFSWYTARFAEFDAKLRFDPADVSAASVEATIDPNSLELPSPPPGFTETLKGPEWLDTAKYPTITFKSTKVEPTGEQTARITGDFTLHGVTRPVTLEATFNGGYAGHEMDPNARIGFSATGSFNRSDFGIAYGVPAPGTTMGVSDQVKVVIEAEFTGPPLAGASGGAK